MKHKFAPIAYLLCLLFLSSCSSVNTKHNTASSADASGGGNVDLNLPGASGSFGDDVILKATPNEETVRLGDRGGDTFTSTTEETVEHGLPRKMRVGLSLGPGLYRAINYIPLLKYLEKQSLAPAVVTGVDFGAVVAGMYACGMTPEVIEWNFYRYFKEKRNYRLYEEEWLEEVDALLLQKLKGKQIQDCDRKLYLTLYNRTTKKTYFFGKGDLRDLLLLNLTLSNGVDLRKKKIHYTSALEDEIFNSQLINKMGIDFSIGADVLGEKFDFEESNEYLVGVYGKAVGKIARQKKGFDYFFTIPLPKVSLDSAKNGASFLAKTQKYIDGKTASFKKGINQKAAIILKATE